MRRRATGSSVRPAVIVLSAVLALGLALPVDAQVDDRLRVQFVRAEVLFRSGDVDGARRLLDAVVAGLADRTDRTEADDLLLRRALVYRTRIAWNAGERDAVDEDLDRLLALDPAVSLEADGVAAGLSERLEARRERRVGYLQIALYPQDAEVRIDGSRVAHPEDIVAVIAGEHRVVASRPGYASAAQEVVVRANRTEGVGFELQRTSATILLGTHPAGATVRVDGDVVGTTEAGGPEGTSELLRVTGLLPGPHDLEVTLPDHRPYRQSFDIPALADYELGTIELDLALGALVLRGLPADAAVEVDGARAEVERQVGAGGTPLLAGSGRLSLPVGDHTIFVTSTAGVYEARVSLGDGDILGVDVDVRPGIAYLGVAGGEDLDRQSVGDQVRTTLSGLDGWFLLDRGDRLGALGRLPEGPADEAGWRRLREQAARFEPGAALYVVATLPERDRAEGYTLWALAAPPGPSQPWSTLVEIGMGDALGEIEATLERPLPEPRAWLGATVLDTGIEDGARVLEVEATGPAGQAGLRAGDLVVGLDGEPLRRASTLIERVERARPFESLALSLARGGERHAVTVSLGASPRVTAGPGTPPAPVVWAAATAALADPATTTLPWVLEFHRGLALLRAGDPRAAANLLGGVRVPGDPPFGQAAVDYWMGIALAQQEEPPIADVRAAFLRAANRAGGRLEHNDGPHVAPRALVRLARTESGNGGS